MKMNCYACKASMENQDWLTWGYHVAFLNKWTLEIRHRENLPSEYPSWVLLCDDCSKKALTKELTFITEYAVVDRIIDHLKLTFAAAKPPPFHVFEQVALEAAEGEGEYF